jgi:tRNA 2-thiouridine synthesizing protein D
MGKLTIGCFASLIGSLNLDFAVKLSAAAMEKGHKVDLWVSGNATMISIEKQRPFKDYSSLEKPLTELMEKKALRDSAWTGTLAALLMLTGSFI